MAGATGKDPMVQDTSNDRKPYLNCCFIGHVDSGKSTTVGQLSRLKGAFTERQLAKLSELAESMGKKSFNLAFYCDTTEAERKRGITIGATLKRIPMDDFDLAIIDCPGHKDFLKNMITGASQADVAVLIVPINKSIDTFSSLRDTTIIDHILVTSYVGAKKMIICINKMDTIANKPEKDQVEEYNSVVKEVKEFVRMYHPDKDPVVIPVSGIDGSGIVEGGKSIPWFKGWTPKDPASVNPNSKVKPPIMSLEGAIKYIGLPERPSNKPFRLPISEVRTVSGAGLIYIGRVTYGVVRPGMNVVIQPSGITAEVKSVGMFNTIIEEGKCGENVGLSLKNVKSGDPKVVKHGFVISTNDATKCKLFPAFEARLTVINHSKGIKAGYCPCLRVSTAQVPAKLAKVLEVHKELIEVDDPKTGKKRKQHKAIAPGTYSPKELKEKLIVKFTEVSAVIVPQKSIVVELYSEFPLLGSFAFLDGNAIVAMGRVTKLLTKEEMDEILKKE